MRLSVFVVTYNQERYIRECLDSILMQEVDFDYEVIVGEDCSTDQTPAICDEYAAKFPQIRVIHHPKNRGLLGNWEAVMNSCKGEYIALLEGDDRWIDPKKLQKQVDWLDAHPDFTLTFTRAEIRYENGAEVGQEKDLPFLREGEVTVQEVCSNFIVLSSSVMCRNCLQPVHFSDQLLYADTYTFIELMKRGRAYCMAFTGTMYRIHGANLSGDGDWNFYVHAYNQCCLFNRIYPELRSVYEPRMESTIIHLLHDRQRSLPYRVAYMRLHPRLWMSRFLLTTIARYMLKLY